MRFLSSTERCRRLNVTDNLSSCTLSYKHCTGVIVRRFQNLFCHPQDWKGRDDLGAELLRQAGVDCFVDVISEVGGIVFLLPLGKVPRILSGPFKSLGIDFSIKVL